MKHSGIISKELVKEVFKNNNIQTGNLIQLSMQYHLRTNNGYLRLYKYPDEPEQQNNVVRMVTTQSPSIDLTCPRQCPPLLYLGKREIKDKMYGNMPGAPLVQFHHIVHLFLLDTTVYYWITKDHDEDLFYQWFEPVLILDK